MQTNYQRSEGSDRSTEACMSILHKSRLVVPVVILALVSVSLSAQALGPRRWSREGGGPGYVAQTMRQILSQAGDKQLGTLTGTEIRKVLDELSIARQKEAYVRRSEFASLMIPGAGQFMNHAPTSGALFLAGDIAVAAGTVVGAYFLLPSDLRFGSTNYFTDSFNTIKNNWMNHSFVDYLPSMAVAAGGMLVDHIIRRIAADNAGSLARENIRTGKVTFRPEPFLLVPGRLGPRFGFGWRMRF